MALPWVPALQSSNRELLTLSTHSTVQYIAPPWSLATPRLNTDSEMRIFPSSPLIKKPPWVEVWLEKVLFEIVIAVKVTDIPASRPAQLLSKVVLWTLAVVSSSTMVKLSLAEFDDTTQEVRSKVDVSM